MVNKFIFDKECTINGINIVKANEYSIRFNDTMKEDAIYDGCFVVCSVSTALRNKLGHVVERLY